MAIYNWNEIPEEEITSLLTRRYISGQNITMARLVLKRGCHIRRHNHESEQLTTVLSGLLRFDMGDEQVLVRAGETFPIPPYAYHAVEALEDTDALDVFAPTRQDWITGTDDYLKEK